VIYTVFNSFYKKVIVLPLLLERSGGRKRELMEGRPIGDAQQTHNPPPANAHPLKGVSRFAIRENWLPFVNICYGS
jgi:hypothetical protein